MSMRIGLGLGLPGRLAAGGGTTDTTLYVALRNGTFVTLRDNTQITVREP